VVTDIGHPFVSAGSSCEAGEVEYALGDDFTVVHFGESQKLARDRDIDWPTKNRSVPSAHYDGLASLKPRRVCPADGQRRDVVQRGLNGQH
jgi:hypothetical protein